MAQDQANFNWQQYAADNPDVLATGYGKNTYSNAADQMWGHYNEANSIGDRRAYTGYDGGGTAAPAWAGGQASTPSGQRIDTGGGGYEDLPIFGNSVQAAGWLDYSQQRNTPPPDPENWEYIPHQDTGEGGFNNQSWIKKGAATNRIDFTGNEKYSGVGDSQNNFQWADHPDWVNQADLQIKSGERAGTNVRYTFDGTNWKPQVTGVSEMDTNARNRMRNLALASVIGAGVGGIALGYGATAGAGATAGGTATAAPITSGAFVNGAFVPGATSTGLSAAGSLGTGAAAGGMTSAEAIAAAYGGVGDVAGGTAASSGMVGQGGIGTYGAGAGMQGGVVAGEAGGGILGASNMGGMGSTSWIDNAKQGYDYYNKAKKANDMINPNQQGQRQPGMIESIFNIGGGIYSANENRDYFKSLEDMYNRREQANAPILAELQRSYTDPSAYLNSAEYKAMAGIEENKLTRGAARTGRLANSTDRDVLMQAHAQKGLNDYRRTLNESMNQTDPFDAKDIFKEAQEAERMANMPIWAAGGYGAGGSGSNPYGQAAQWAWDNVDWDDVSSWGDTIGGWFA